MEDIDSCQELLDPDVTVQRGSSTKECRRALFTERNEVKLRLRTGTFEIDCKSRFRQLVSFWLQVGKRIEEIDLTALDTLWTTTASTQVIRYFPRSGSIIANGSSICLQLHPQAQQDDVVVAKGFNYSIRNRALASVEGSNHLNDEVSTW